MDITDLSEYVRLSKESLGLLRGAISLLPHNANRDEIETKLRAAEEALRRSDARLAQDLGIPLCACDFPPLPMRSKGYHERYNKEIFECPQCGKQNPPPIYFEQHDRVTEHNRTRGSSWVDARRGR